MADTVFDLNKLKSIIDKIFKGLGNIVDGYTTESGDVETKSGTAITHVVIKPNQDMENTTPITIDLAVTNVDSAFNDITYAIKNLTTNALNNKKIRSGINMLTDAETSGRIKYDQSVQHYVGDITVHSGEGMLGIDLEKIDSWEDNKFDTWGDFVFNKFTYSLHCEAENFDQGKIDGISLEDAGKWIFKYIDVVNNKDTNKQATREEKISRENKAMFIGFSLVKPILIDIQQQLGKMYQDKLNDETSLDQLIPGNKPEDSEEAPSLSDITQPETQTAESEDNGGETSMENSAKHISVKLKTINGSVELLGLESNYLPADTLDDMDDIINQEEFINILTEEPQSFGIDVDEDGYDIEQCDNCQIDPNASLCEVFKAGIRAYRNLYIIHWMSSGNDMMKLHLLAEEMYGELIQEIDTLGELLVEKQGTVPQLDFPCDYVPVQKYDFQGSLETIKSLVQMYINCIDYAYCNQPSDVQSTLDEWLRYWNKQINYFVKNQED